MLPHTLPTVISLLHVALESPAQAHLFLQPAAPQGATPRLLGKDQSLCGCFQVKEPRKHRPSSPRSLWVPQPPHCLAPGLEEAQKPYRVPADKSPLSTLLAYLEAGLKIQSILQESVSSSARQTNKLLRRVAFRNKLDYRCNRLNRTHTLDFLLAFNFPHL